VYKGWQHQTSNKHGNFHGKNFHGLKIFNVTLKFEGKIFVTKTVIIIVEKAMHMTTQWLYSSFVMNQLPHFWQKAKYYPV